MRAKRRNVLDFLQESKLPSSCPATLASRHDSTSPVAATRAKALRVMGWGSGAGPNKRQPQTAKSLQCKRARAASSGIQARAQMRTRKTRLPRAGWLVISANATPRLRRTNRPVRKGLELMTHLEGCGGSKLAPFSIIYAHNSKNSQT